MRKSASFQTTLSPSSSLFFFFKDTATPEIYTLSLHDALPISTHRHRHGRRRRRHTRPRHGDPLRLPRRRPPSRNRAGRRRPHDGKPGRASLREADGSFPKTQRRLTRMATGVERTPRFLRYLAPKLITLSSMIFGLVSLWSASHGPAGAPLAAWMIIYAVLTDRLDGLAARSMKATP